MSAVAGAGEGSRGPGAPIPATLGDPAGVEPIRVLIMEDDYLIGLDIADAVEQAGMQVAAIVDQADRALLLAATEPIDFATMDINLHGRPVGLELAQTLFDRFAIRSLFVTAYADRRLEQAAAAARPLGWCNKPFTPEALKLLLQAAGAQIE